MSRRHVGAAIVFAAVAALAHPFFLLVLRGLHDDAAARAGLLRAQRVRLLDVVRSITRAGSEGGLALPRALHPDGVVVRADGADRRGGVARVLPQRLPLPGEARACARHRAGSDRWRTVARDVVGKLVAHRPRSRDVDLLPRAGVLLRRRRHRAEARGGIVGRSLRGGAPAGAASHGGTVASVEGARHLKSPALGPAGELRCTSERPVAVFHGGCGPLALGSWVGFSPRSRSALRCAER